MTRLISKLTFFFHYWSGISFFKYPQLIVIKSIPLTRLQYRSVLGTLKIVTYIHDRFLAKLKPTLLVGGHYSLFKQSWLAYVLIRQQTFFIVEIQTMSIRRLFVLPQRLEINFNHLSMLSPSIQMTFRSASKVSMSEELSVDRVVTVLFMWLISWWHSIDLSCERCLLQPY